MILFIFLEFIMVNCLFYYDSSVSVCGSSWMSSRIYSEVWNFEVALSCEVSFTDEYDVYVLFFEEQLLHLCVEEVYSHSKVLFLRTYSSLNFT
jgi:hypothetical protein